MFPETFLLVVYTFHIKFYFSGKRQRKSTKNLSKTCHWNLTFVIWSYSRWALRHARYVSMQARKAHEHVSTWACKHARHVGTWACNHTKHVGTWARKHTRHVSMQGTLARKHAKHVGMWTCKAHNLADLSHSWII